jgi:ribosomal protein S28E/S33
MVLLTMQVFWVYDAVSLGEAFLTFQIGLLDPKDEGRVILRNI